MRRTARAVVEKRSIARARVVHWAGKVSETGHGDGLKGGRQRYMACPIPRSPFCASRSVGYLNVVQSRSPTLRSLRATRMKTKKRPWKTCRNWNVTLETYSQNDGSLKHLLPSVQCCNADLQSIISQHGRQSPQCLSAGRASLSAVPPSNGGFASPNPCTWRPIPRPHRIPFATSRRSGGAPCRPLALCEMLVILALTSF